jgi:hypothetical protein
MTAEWPPCCARVTSSRKENETAKIIIRGIQRGELDPDVDVDAPSTP